MTAIPFIGAQAFFVDGAGAPLINGSVYFWQAGTNNVPLATWRDFAQTVVNPNPIPLTNAGVPLYEIWGDGGYHIMWYDSNNNLIGEIDNFFLAQNTGIPFFVTTGSPNAYIGTPSPAISAYTNGLVFNVLWNFTNTGASTINISGLGAVDLVDPSGNPLVPGENLIGTIGTIIFNNGSFVVANPQNPTEIPIYTTTGAANAYILSPAPALTAYGDVAYFIKASFTNTGAATINVSGLGNSPLKYSSGAPLVGGEIVVGYTYEIAVRTSEVIVLNPTPLLAPYYLSTGSAGAYQITTSQGIGAYVEGMSFTMTANFGSTNNPTLQIDSLAALNIVKNPAVFVRSDDMTAANIYSLTLVNGNWVLQNPDLPISITSGLNSSPLPGFLPLNGSTLAKTSGATYNDSNAFRAFNYLWYSVSDVEAPVSGGRGVTSLADWNANKNILLPDITGRSLFGVKAGSPITVPAGTAGALTVASTGSVSSSAGNTGSTSLTTSQIEAHPHNFSTDGTAFGQFGIIPATVFRSSSGDSTQATVVSKDTDNTGGGLGHTHTGSTVTSSFTGNATSVLQPSFGVYYYINY